VPIIFICLSSIVQKMTLMMLEYSFLLAMAVLGNVSSKNLSTMHLTGVVFSMNMINDVRGLDSGKIIID
jgi:hypothetical protein